MSRVVIHQYTYRYLGDGMYGEADGETLAEGATLKEAIVNLRKAFGGRLPNYWGPQLRAGKRIRVWRGWEIESLEDGETEYVEAYEIDDDENEEPL